MGLISWEEYRLKNRKTACVAENNPPQDPFEEKAAETQDVDRLNEVTKEELLAIKGIGPKTAAAILQNAPYNDLDDIEMVKGVSKKAAESLREWIISEA